LDSAGAGPRLDAGEDPAAIIGPGELGTELAQAGVEQRGPLWAGSRRYRFLL